MNNSDTPEAAKPPSNSKERGGWVPRPGSALTALPGQPLCRHYTGATLANLTGDYSCCCLAGVPYERWTPDMERWPCRRRHLLGLEQHGCRLADYGTDMPEDVDKQLTEMTLRATAGDGTQNT